MERTGAVIFDHITVSNVRFIKLDNEFKYLFQNFYPFLAKFHDYENIVHFKLLGDLKIGFY